MRFKNNLVRQLICFVFVFCLAQSSFSYASIGPSRPALKTPSVVSEVTNLSDEIVGKTYSNVYVEAKIDGEVIGIDYSDEDGTYSMYIGETLAVGDEISITAIQEKDTENEIKSMPFKVTVKKASKPVINEEITSKMDYISGKTLPGVEVIVKINGVERKRQYSDYITGEFLIDINYNNYFRGGDKVTIVASRNGNYSEELNLTAKNLLDPPEVNEILHTSKVIEGNVKMGVSKVVAKVGNKEIGSTKAVKYNRFTMSIPAQPKGTKIILVGLDDYGSKSEEIQIVVTNVKQPITETDMTNRDKEIKGTADPGAEVIAKFNKKEIGKAKADSKGKFKITIKPIEDGIINESYVELTAINSKGEKSNPKLVYVEWKPRFEVYNTEITDKTTEIKGKTEPYSVFTLSITGQSTQRIVVKENGEFTIKIKPQKPGTKIALYGDWDTGGGSGWSLQIDKIVKKSIETPSVNKVNTKSKTVSGKSTKGATVIVKIGTKTYTGKVDSKGNYSIKVPEQKLGVKMSVTAKDSSGQVSSAKTVTVVKAPPSIPTVNKVNTKSKTVSGKSEKGTTVTVKIGKKTYTGKVNSKGSYSIKVPVQKKGVKVSVTAKDSSGQLSTTKTITVVK